MKSQRATSGRRYIKIGLTVDSVRDEGETRQGRGGPAEQ